MFRLLPASILARLLAACFTMCCLSAPAGAATDADATPPPPDGAAQVIRSLHYQRGKITLKNNLATLDVPDTFRFLDADDARKVVVDVWHNPPDAADGVLGMLVPAHGTTEEGQSYGVVITYDDRGYVKDDDAGKINYMSLLQEMQKATHDQNEARTKAGYPAMELVGWAAPPRYDQATKKLYWAKELQINGDDAHGLNYDIRILGRRGVLVLDVVAGIEQLGQINQAAPQILSMVNFQQGNRYADFNPKTDKVAAYGLAALVAGGILAKAGGLKLLFGLLIAAKKFLVIGAVAVASFFKKLFGREKRVNDGPQSLPPAPPDSGVDIGRPPR